MIYARRMSEYAKELAQKESDPKRKAELLEISRVNARVPAHKPETFWEAIQAVWTIESLLVVEENQTGMSIGRVDQYMYPYYIADKKAGILTDEEALELIQCLYIKVADIIKLRNSYYSAAFAGYVMWPTLLVGGQTPDGHDASNELSYLALEASNGIKLHSPAIASASVTRHRRRLLISAWR